MPTSSGWCKRPACPIAWLDAPWTPSPRWHGSRAGSIDRPPEQVHFHEVGGHDTIIDVVGTAAALEVLGVDEVTSSAVATGTGTVRSAHGFIPNPSPAVVNLLVGVPTWGRDVSVELTTPTGAAILAAMASGFGPMPPMRISATGFGAGSNELDGLPNCTQVVVGQSLAVGPGPGQPLMLLEANLDDATGEALAYTVAKLLEVGAHDAWITPIVMKKGRPGHTVSALADAALAEAVRAALAGGDRDARGAGHLSGALAGGAGHGRSGGGRGPGAGQGEPGAGEDRATGRGPSCRPYRLAPA